MITSTYLLDQDSSLIAGTIIDGNQDGSVVIFENNENSDAVLQGLLFKMVMDILQTLMEMGLFTVWWWYLLSGFRP